jgi:nucleoside-diphosphate-sugar epimerase
VSSSAASTASWSKLNALYEENAATSYQAIQNAYADIALLSPPNSPNFIFPGTALDYIYNPLLTVNEHNATPPHSPVPYALLKLAKEALCHQCLDEEDGSPLPSLQYPLLEAFIPDEEIPVKELPPPQVFIVQPYRCSCRLSNPPCCVGLE